MDNLFSPPPGIPAAIKSYIDAAVSTIDICLYRFTEPTLAAAMRDAVARGVACRAILDFKSAYALDSMSWTLSRDGTIVYTDAAHSVMHCKYAIIDSSLIMDGSANWSQNADGFAAETYTIDPGNTPRATLYQNNFNYHLTHSIPLPR